MKKLMSKLRVWILSLKLWEVLKVKFSGLFETEIYEGHLLFYSRISHTLPVIILSQVNFREKQLRLTSSALPMK